MCVHARALDLQDSTVDSRSVVLFLASAVSAVHGFCVRALSCGLRANHEPPSYA